jgi:hypothetical protein
MKRFARALAVVLVLLLAAATASLAQETKKDSTPAYLFSILLGFGTGHFYLQDKAAVKFLLLDLGSLAASMVGIGLMTYSLIQLETEPYSLEFPTGYLFGIGLGVLGSLFYSGFRIWEVVDVIKTVNEQQAAGKVTLMPSMRLEPGGTQLGVTLSY